MNKIFQFKLKFEEKLRRSILDVRLDFEYTSEGLNSLKEFEPKLDICVPQDSEAATGVFCKKKKFLKNYFPKIHPANAVLGIIHLDLHGKVSKQLAFLIP